MKCFAFIPSVRVRALPLSYLGGAALALMLSACSPSHNAPTEADATPASQNLAAVARGKVDIEGGLLALSMPREGTLTSVVVHEGDHVKKGQLLATLDIIPATLAIDAAASQVQEAQAQQKLMAVKQTAAKQRATRLAAAASAGAGDGQSADDAREAVEQLSAEEQSATAALGMSQQKLTQARYELKLRSLVAPFDAQVIHVSAQPGASVSPTSGPLFTLLPKKPRIVRAELNESFVGAIHAGMHAQVSANDGAKNTQWDAHVVRVGQVYGPATLENDPQVRANARTVECVLAFDQPQNLRIGQRVIVRFDATTTATPSKPLTLPKD
ncbi:MAG: HlyD family efflux transporter periplasmic adaptor subunit [Rhodanobacter sp.]